MALPRAAKTRKRKSFLATSPEMSKKFQEQEGCSCISFCDFGRVRALLRVGMMEKDGQMEGQDLIDSGRMRVLFLASARRGFHFPSSSLPLSPLSFLIQPLINMAPNCAAEDTHRYRSRDMNSLINTKGSRPMRTFSNRHPTHASDVYST